MSSNKILPLILLSAIVFVGCTTSTTTDSDAAGSAGSTTGETNTSQTDTSTDDSQLATSAEFTLAEIAEFDGQNGNRCVVAVNGIVYEISDSSLWVNGSHTTSSGRAFCGADLSDVITQSPHGSSKLSSSSKVSELGVLVN